MKKFLTILFLFFYSSYFAQNMVLEVSVGFLRTVTLPLWGTVDVTVYWGDGAKSFDKYTSAGNKSHTYSSAGTYTITISGTLTQFGNGSSGYNNSYKIVEVTSFGNIGLTSLSGAFYNATNLTNVPTTIPSSITSLGYAFSGATSFNQDISNWDVSNVTNMYEMFDGVTLRVDYYSNILIKWFALSLQSNVIFDGGNSQYDPGLAESSRLDIIRNYGWSIIDGGQNTSMILIYDTDLVNTTDVDIYFPSPPPNVTIDWGDGTAIENVTTSGYIFHTYNSDDTYMVHIDGSCGGISVSENKLVEVVSFGDIGLTHLISTFANSPNLITVPKFLPSSMINNGVVYFFDVFRGATSFNQDISSWDVSYVAWMSGVFYDATSFNQDISNWDVSNVTINMNDMFRGATSFNQNISNWNVGNVTEMNRMFYGATSFNQDISNWNVGSVTEMEEMFDGATSFNQSLSSWDVSNVTNMSRMFENATSFNGSLAGWVLNSVTDISFMFNSATSFNQSLSNWDLSNLTSMSHVFYYASSFNQDISNWDVSNVSSMYRVFDHASSFNQDISNWDVSSITQMTFMFAGATSFNQDMSGWNVSNVTRMNYMFSNATSFDQDISSWNVSNVIDMEKMFDGARLSTANYDALLIAWSNLILQHDVSFSGGNSEYSKGSAATARQSIIDNFNWTITDDGPAGLVPVELTDFIAELNGGHVLLTWQTATEVNNYGFEIERSSLSATPVRTGEMSWEVIGFVDGHGNSNSPKEYSFVTSTFRQAQGNASSATTLNFRLKQIDFNGAFEYSDVVTVELDGNLEYKLAQNSPNPFNPSTQISFTIPKSGVAKLNVYNMLGEKVAELVNQNLEAGSHQYQFDASNLTSGIYFYSISVNGFREVKKMNLVK